jgi:alpha-tubulin suppressor-like RCC1 family protein
VMADSSLTCWGSNAYGQSTPSAGSYSAVSTGRRHACALDSFGVATCWGDNSYGERQAPAGNFISLAAGEDFTCGLSATGDLSCWGNVPAGL